MQTFLLAVVLSVFSCKNNVTDSLPKHNSSVATSKISPEKITDTASWEYFLQHLPERKGFILDYKGGKVDDQDKHYALINYDVGKRDLQQCADALMRLRAEYLFARNRFSEIGFHFTSGDFYSFTDYCSGKKPVPKGNSVAFVQGQKYAQTHESLRSYLDIIYTYAGTISLASELKNATAFSIGTVVIAPGSPGHCFIITDEATNTVGEELFKLVEGYTPAQTIYVLKNTSNAALGYWHPLKGGTITTASYEFDSYLLKKFE